MYKHNQKKAVSRLHIIQGQLKGLEKMVDENKYCIDIMRWDDPTEEVEMDKSLLENVRSKLPKEEDLEGAEWNVLDLKEELDRAWEDAKSNSKKVVKETESNNQETANA